MNQPAVPLIGLFLFKAVLTVLMVRRLQVPGET
jgi:hypothetical protein